MMEKTNNLEFKFQLSKFDGYFQLYFNYIHITMENTVNYYEMTDKALLALIGRFIQETRIKQHKTQQQTAGAAGINRSTLVQIENGRGGAMLSLIQVLRVLQQLHVFNGFETPQQASPLLLAKLELQKRKRVRNSNAEDNKPDSNW